MGVLDAFVEGRDEMAWLRHMWDRSADLAQREGFELPDFDLFWAQKTYRIPEEEPRLTWLGAFRRDPDDNPLRTPSGKIEIYSQQIADYEYADCPGSPVWLEPFERLGGQGSDDYPLHLLSPQPERRLHSQLDHAQYSQDGKIKGKEVLFMHPVAAQQRGISDGDVVRVYNARGACLAGVKLDAERRLDVVSLPTGAWFRPQSRSLELNGNPNVLTRDKGTSSLAQGPSSGTCLVEVEYWHSQAESE